MMMNLILTEMKEKDRMAPICLVNQILENDYSLSMNRLINRQ